MITLKDIKNNWLILAFVFASIVWYANTNNRIKNVEAQVQENKTVLQVVYKIQIDLATMKADISYIKANMK